MDIWKILSGVGMLLLAVVLLKLAHILANVVALATKEAGDIACKRISLIRQTLAIPITFLVKLLMEKIRVNPAIKGKKASLQDTRVSRLVEKHPWMGTTNGVYIALGCIAVTTVTILVSVCFGGWQNLLIDAVFTLPILNIVSILMSLLESDGNSWTEIAMSLVSAGVCATMIGWLYSSCVNGYKHQNLVGWLVRAGYFVVTMVASCILSSILNDICDWFAHIGLLGFENFGNIYYDTAAKLVSGGSFLYIFPAIGAGVLFLVLQYLLLLLVLVALQDSVEVISHNVCAVIFILVPYFAIMLLLENFDTTVMQGIISLVGILWIAAMVFLADFSRVEPKIMEVVFGWKSDDLDVPEQEEEERIDEFVDAMVSVVVENDDNESTDNFV